MAINNPDEIALVLQQIKQEVRSLQLHGQTGQPAALITALEQVRLTSWVNPHQPIAWPRWPNGLWSKAVALAQKVIRHLLRWYINPIVEEQNQFNAAVEITLRELVAENARLRAELQLLAAHQPHPPRQAESQIDTGDQEHFTL